MFMMFLSAFNLLLSRYSGSSDVVVGAPIAGRSQEETHESIGYFVNTLALRVDMSNLTSVADLLSRVRKCCLDGYSHADVPFHDVVDSMVIQRDSSYSPVFQAMFTLLDDGTESGCGRVALCRVTDTLMWSWVSVCV